MSEQEINIHGASENEDAQIAAYRLQFRESAKASHEAFQQLSPPVESISGTGVRELLNHPLELAKAKAALRGNFSLLEVLPADPYKIKSATVEVKQTNETPERPTATLTSLPETITAELLPMCSFVEDAKGENRWFMHPEARRKTLAGYSIGKIKELVPDPWINSVNVSERMIARCLYENEVNVSSLTYEELSALLQLLRWAPNGLKDRIPKEDKLQYWRDFHEMLLPFRKLTKEFRGRKTELDRLTKYVEWLPPSSFLDAIVRATRNTFDLKEKPPLVITGLGGVGKSTLVSKFILDHIDGKHGGEQIPFVYLDFDRPGFSFNDPLTILAESARQLGLQQRSATREMSDFYSKWDSQFRGGDASASASSVEKDDALREFAECWAKIDPNQEIPLLMVLDSFEEVQATLGARVIEVFDFLQKAVGFIPRLRVVISGRWPVNFHSDEMPLGDFDKEAAIGFLKGFGVDEETGLLIFERYKGNPLTLQLAAGIFNKDEAKTKVKDWLFRRIDEEQIQKELFRRNLDHIHNPQVRKVAMPGLVVRKLDSEVLKHVLAAPCGLGQISNEEADAIIRKLRDEPNIVDPGPQGTVYYRQDLRKKMLPLIEASDPVRVRAIHDAAVDFYEKRKTPEDEAEQIYHRLARYDPIDSVRLLIRPEHKPFLQNSMDELSPVAHVALAGVFGTDVPESIRREADLVDFEVVMQTKITQVLSSGFLPAFQSVKDELARERRERLPNSHLRRSEALLSERLGEITEARQLAEVALEDARRVVDYWGQGEMHLSLARLHEREFNWSKAASAYRRALTVSISYNFGQCITAFILSQRLQARRGRDARSSFSRLLRRITSLLAQSATPLSTQLLKSVHISLQPILPLALEPPGPDIEDWLWRAVSSRTVLPDERLKFVYAKLIREENAPAALESISVAVTGNYSRFSGVAGGASKIQAFDFILSMERSAGSTEGWLELEKKLLSAAP